MYIQPHLYPPHKYNILQWTQMLAYYPTESDIGSDVEKRNSRNGVKNDDYIRFLLTYLLNVIYKSYYHKLWIHSIIISLGYNVRFRWHQTSSYKTHYMFRPQLIYKIPTTYVQNIIKSLHLLWHDFLIFRIIQRLHKTSAMNRYLKHIRNQMPFDINKQKSQYHLRLQI